MPVFLVIAMQRFDSKKLLNQSIPILLKRFEQHRGFIPDQNQDWILWLKTNLEIFSFEQPMFKIWSNPMAIIRSDYFWTTGPCFHFLRALLSLNERFQTNALKVVCFHAGDEESRGQRGSGLLLHHPAPPPQTQRLPQPRQWFREGERSRALAAERLAHQTHDLPQGNTHTARYMLTTKPRPQTISLVNPVQWYHRCFQLHSVRICLMLKTCSNCSTVISLSPPGKRALMGHFIKFKCAVFGSEK